MVAEGSVGKRDDITLRWATIRAGIRHLWHSLARGAIQDRLVPIWYDEIIDSIYDLFNAVVNRSHKIEIVLKRSAELRLKLLFVLEEDRHLMSKDRFSRSAQDEQVAPLDINLEEADRPIYLQAVDCESPDGVLCRSISLEF